MFADDPTVFIAIDYVVAEHQCQPLLLQCTFHLFVFQICVCHWYKLVRTMFFPGRVRLYRVENLKFDQADFLSVEVSLHFGCKTLHKPVSTTNKLHVAFRAVWNEDLEFNFKLRDIPKV